MVAMNVPWLRKGMTEYKFLYRSFAEEWETAVCVLNLVLNTGGVCFTTRPSASRRFGPGLSGNLYPPDHRQTRRGLFEGLLCVDTGDCFQQFPN